MKFSLRYLVFGSAVALVVAGSGYGLYRYVAVAQELASLKKTATKQELDDKQQKKLIETIGRLIELPTDEKPTIATVADVEKLKNQPFFLHAQNGDILLIYPTAKKAILYRPTLNKIIEVAPIAIGPTTTPSIKIALRNGTSIVGITKKYETELKAKIATADVVDRDNAKKRDYEKTVIIDVAGTKQAQVAELAKALGITVGAMPKDEATTSADFLIIVGLDKK